MNADTRCCGEPSIGFVHNISHTSGRARRKLRGQNDRDRVQLTCESIRRLHDRWGCRGCWHRTRHFCADHFAWGHAGNPTAQSSRYLSALLRALRPSLGRIASRSRNTGLNTVLPATLCARAVPVATLSPPRATAAWGRTHGSSCRSGFFRPVTTAHHNGWDAGQARISARPGANYPTPRSIWSSVPPCMCRAT